MRLPVQYLANLLTAGKQAPIVSALNRMIAMRSYQRSVHVEGKADTRALEAAGISESTALEMYRYLAIANYEDRFVIPTGHAEVTLEDFHGFQGQNGFTFGNDTAPGVSKITLVPRRRKESMEPKEPVPPADKESGQAAMSTYKLLSVLLEYPEQELIDHLPELSRRVAASAGIDDAERAALRGFIDYLAGKPLTALQEDYVQTFDLTAEHSLHLTHHLFGDDKNRGPALIDLGELYKDYGVRTQGNELPDYLPLILEFAAQLGDDEATVFLSDAGKVFKALTDNLKQAGSPYAALTSIIEGRSTLIRLTA
jgi:nitrate reductase molybdenum cofactor assembly chaperone